MSTISDLDRARANLALALGRYEGYEGNNPSKHRAALENARAEVHRIEQTLKDAGVLERTTEEQLWYRLDCEFPDAQSRQIVQFEGKMYQRRYTPVAKSLSGKTVKAWHAFWEAL